MKHAFKERVLVKPGGLIEISHPELTPGEEAEVIVMLDPATDERLQASTAASSSRPIWEVVVELGSEVPEAEWAKVPKDLATNLDHYLYGVPKPEE
jgi:hypothetical protein